MEATGEMSGTGIKPRLLLADVTESPLALLAVAQGWRVARTIDLSTDCSNAGQEISAPATGTDAPLNDTPFNDASVAIVVLNNPATATLARSRFPGALLVGASPTCKTCVDVYLGSLSHSGSHDDRAFLRQILTHGQTHWETHHALQQAQTKVAVQQQRIKQLSEVGATLSSEIGFDELLAKLLTEARAIACCDGASLYLVENRASQDGTSEERLVFKLTQNGSLELPFNEITVPLTSASIAGHAAVSGGEINLRDAYALPENAPYEFNRSFDEKMGYRTRSMLVMPMRDHGGGVVGVLQFINRFADDGVTVVEFDADTVEVLRSIASQAALTIQKNRLMSDINELFESFVQASVKAIEQRDPSTSGHSARVAETTVALLQALPMSNLPRFKNMVIPEDHLREVRYAALLHDFGKVGVSESILLKSHKISSERLEILHYRVQLQKERLRRAAVEKEVDMLHHHATDFEVARARVHRELQKQLSILDDYYSMIERANNPTVLLDGDFSHLRELHSYSFVEPDGTNAGLISVEDLNALSVRRGSLTQQERVEIEAHVQWTKDFLAVLPWPKELSQVPEIAGAHHEKLNGKGYPQGLMGEQIPLASRVMTVCDIYDALTAMDRPYKSAIGDDRAFEILYMEAKEGLLDTDLVDVFVASRNQVKQANTAS